MQVVGVRLASSARARTCEASGINVDVGDPCIVLTEAGPEFGTVVSAALDNPHFVAGAPMPRVVRRASLEDEESYARKVFAEKEAEEYCLGRIRERGLSMRLGRVEGQLDGKRMTFYFTSEGRVDFRELVRDLSARFHTRIELRQVGEREDAAMRGGVGPCGRMLCCSTFLRKFEPISIKMAKAQGLSLNPSKISGLCGRLMCCLKYEFDTHDRGRTEPARGPAQSPDTPSDDPGGPAATS